MPSDDDNGDYETALDSTTTQESSTESDPVVKRDASASPSAAAEAEAKAKVGGPVGDVDTVEQGPRGPRVWNDKSRAMFRDLVKQVQTGETEIADDLEPMQHATPHAAAAPAATAPPAVVTPPAAATAAPLAPVAAPVGLPPLPLTPLPAQPQASPQPAAAGPDPKHVEREAALAAREAALLEREKLMPDRTELAERPGTALIGWLRDTMGITGDADLKTALTDLVTELSEVGLGVELPAEVKTSLEARKALRSVKAYKATLDKREQSLAEQRAAHEKAAAEAREAAEAKQRDAAYVARIGELIAPAREQHKFLHDPEVTGGLAAPVIVYEVLKEQKRLGQEPDLAKATEYANNYYKAHAEAEAKRAARFQSLLAPPTPAPAVAPVVAAPSPGGAPGPAPKTPAQPAPVEWDASDLPMDRQQRRSQALAKLVAAKKAASQQA